MIDVTQSYDDRRSFMFNFNDLLSKCFFLINARHLSMVCLHCPLDAVGQLLPEERDVWLHHAPALRTLGNGLLHHFLLLERRKHIEDAAAEIGRNPVSKHQIQPEYGDEQADP